MLNTGIQVIFIKVDKDTEKIKRLLTKALLHRYSINGDISIDEYIEQNAEKMLYLSFDSNDECINFCRYELVGEHNNILSEEEFDDWLRQAIPE